ncbi:MAG: alpha/beta hydrolase [Stagnimonas sp.]|nr:alpha/beta hydrolase [Stagnimonas sp.]
MNISTLLSSALVAAALAAAALPASAAPHSDASVAPLRSTGPGSAWPRPSLRCVGSEAPTVVFDTSGESLGLWNRVVPLLSTQSRVCVWNVGAPAIPDSDAVALHAALQQAGERPPYLRVVHGLGGPRAAAFAARYPQEVLGLALVDVSGLSAPRELPDDLLLAVVSSTVPAESARGQLLDVSWQSRQAAIAGLSTQSFHFVGDNQRGLLPERDPETVATAIDWLRRQVRLAATASDVE